MLISTLRRSVGGVLASCARQGPGGLPPAAAAAAALPAELQQMRLASGGAKEPPAGLQPVEATVQPFSKAMQQLEEALTGEVLPADVLAANRKAMADLKAFVANLSPQYGWPPSHAKQVQFVVRNPYADGRLQRVRMLLKTTGGNCAPMVQQTLGQLLQQAGLPPYFYWDGDQFRNRAKPRTRPVAKPNMQGTVVAPPPTPAEVQATRAKAAAAGFPSQTITEEQFKQMEAQSQQSREDKAAAAAATDELAAKIQKLDPLFSAVAALPWLSRMPDKDMRQKVRMIRATVMDKLEAEGWDIRGPVRRIWDGERNLELLQQGKDTGSRDAIKSILFHAVLYDRKHGKREGVVLLAAEDK